MRFKTKSQCSALSNSSSWKRERNFRTRVCVWGLTNWTFKSFLHKLLIAKLNQYGFHNKAVKIVYDCLTSRKQKTKISDKYKTHGRKIYWEYPKPQRLDNVPLNLFQWFIDNEMKKTFFTDKFLWSCAYECWCITD